MTQTAENVAAPPANRSVGGGALINVISVHPHDLAEFDGWYSTEHFPERLAVTGFRDARRFVEHPRRDTELVEFLSIYRTDSVDVLTSDEYLRALDSPTPRTRAAVALFRENERTVGRLLHHGGPGRTGDVLLGRVTCDRARAADVAEHLIGAATRAIDDGTAEGVSLYESDAEAASAKDSTAEGRAVGDDTSAPDHASTVTLLLLVDRHGSLEPAPVDRLVGDASTLPEAVRWSTYRVVSDHRATPPSTSSRQD